MGISFTNYLENICESDKFFFLNPGYLTVDFPITFSGNQKINTKIYSPAPSPPKNYVLWIQCL